VRHRHDAGTGGHRNGGAPGAVAARLARRHARALGKHHDPHPVGETALALLDHLAHRRAAGTAVDGDGAQQPDAPADERDPRELALKHPGLRRQDHRLRERLPARGMLHQRHVAAGGQVLASDDDVVQPADDAQRPEQDASPETCQREPRAVRQHQAHDREEDRVEERPDPEKPGEAQRPQRLHGYVLSAGAATAVQGR
jgi:hypothetical protein